MKKTLTVLFACVLLASANAQYNVDDFTSNLDSFLEELNAATPDNAVTGGKWSDAYIGQLLGVPPHFGVGASAGLSRFPAKGLYDVFNALDLEFPVDSEDLVMPTAGIEARIGGIVFPFDAGIRMMVIPETTMNDLTFDYILFGIDARYPIIKGNIVLPAVSVGVGYTYLGGSVGTSVTSSQITGIDMGEWETTEDLAVSFKASVIDVSAQVSKGLFLITPYAGLGATMSFAESSYTVGPLRKTVSSSPFGARVYGGLSFNLLVLKIDSTVMYNFMSENWAINLGTRVQL